VRLPSGVRRIHGRNRAVNQRKSFKLDTALHATREGRPYTFAIMKPLFRQPCANLAVLALTISSTFSIRAQTPPDQILLKDYKPRSIFKIPETRVEKARYPVIDVHSHDYARTDDDVARWVSSMDASNDGLMNAWKWRITNAPGVLSHDDVVNSLARAVKKHPRTTFIACHLANCCSDLDRVGAMLDQSPNLYADMGARFGELASTPRAVVRFFQRYQNRLFYGTDMDPEPEMYRTTFRLLETADEHFYPVYFRKYHWPMNAYALPDEVLKKVYRENALRVLRLE